MPNSLRKHSFLIESVEERQWQQPGPVTKFRYRSTARGERVREGLLAFIG
jgi:hypothetical protein